MNDALTAPLQTSLLHPPEGATKESVTIHLSAGNSTIHYVELKVGEGRVCEA